MVRLEKATAEMFERIYPLLQQLSANNPQITKRHWEMLFRYPWQVEEDRRGFVLLDDDKVVGFEAAIFSERLIAGVGTRVCNLSSWVVLPDYRRYAMLFVEGILGLQDTIVTALTTRPELGRINAIMGYSLLEKERRLIRLRPQWPWTAWWTYRTTVTESGMRRILNSEDLRIHRDHSIPTCEHLAVFNRQNNREYCYLVFSVAPWGRFNHCVVHYISHLDVFVKSLEVIKLRLLVRFGCVVLAVDERMLGGVSIPGSQTVPLSAPRLFMNSQVKAEQMDNLYSEMVMLPL